MIGDLIPSLGWIAQGSQQVSVDGSQAHGLAEGVQKKIESLKLKTRLEMSKFSKVEHVFFMKVTVYNIKKTKQNCFAARNVLKKKKKKLSLQWSQQFSALRRQDSFSNFTNWINSKPEITGALVQNLKLNRGLIQKPFQKKMISSLDCCLPNCVKGYSWRCPNCEEVFYTVWNLKNPVDLNWFVKVVFNSLTNFQLQAMPVWGGFFPTSPNSEHQPDSSKAVNTCRPHATKSSSRLQSCHICSFFSKSRGELFSCKP